MKETGSPKMVTFIKLFCASDQIDVFPEPVIYYLLDIRALSF
jgi:hypothetical protein